MADPGIVLDNGECTRCYGNGVEPGTELPLSRVRVFPSEQAQAVHELLQEQFSPHDDVECFCCCFDCPGWTMDTVVMSDEMMNDLIPCHDFRSGRPFPARLSQAAQASRRIPFDDPAEHS